MTKRFSTIMGTEAEIIRVGRAQLDMRPRGIKIDDNYVKPRIDEDYSPQARFLMDNHWGLVSPIRKRKVKVEALEKYMQS